MSGQQPLRLPSIFESSKGRLSAPESWQGQSIGCCLKIKKVNELPSIKRPEHLVYLEKKSERKQRNTGKKEKRKREKVKQENGGQEKGGQEKGGNGKKDIQFKFKDENLLKINNDFNRARMKKSKMSKKRIADLEKVSLEKISARIKEIGRLRVESEHKEDHEDARHRCSKTENSQLISIFVPS